MDIRTYLALEIGLSHRLSSEWKKISTPVYNKIAECIRKEDWHGATLAVHDLDMEPIGVENEGYIRYVLAACAQFGGRRANKTGSDVLNHPDADRILTQTTSNIKQYLSNRATSQIQIKALQSIAKAENASKQKQITSVTKFNPNHDAQGKFTESSEEKTTMYRGVGVGSTSEKDILWVTPDKELAAGYAKARESGSVEEHHVSLGNVFDAGQDKRELTPKEFASKVIAQADIPSLDKNSALAAREAFIQHMGNESGPMLELWENDEAKKHTSEFLKAMGFDSIKLEEDGKPTYGLLKSSTTKEDKKKLYVSRPLLNGQAFIAWAKSQGFDTVLPENELHVTCVYSNEPVDWSAIPPDTKPLVVNAGGDRRIQVFGKDNDVGVLTFSNQELHDRWQKWRDAGASWDFPTYEPHVSITYSIPKDLDVTKVELPSFPLIFGGEEYEPIKDDYKEDIVEKADEDGRYVTDFVSFADEGMGLIQMISSLNTNRLSTWGFTAQADAQGATRYQLSAVLDSRTSIFCQFIDGKQFDVQDAKDQVNESLSVQDPEDLKTVQPWPDQSKKGRDEWEGMSEQELVDNGWSIPPFHPYCRTLCTMIENDDTGEPPPDIGSAEGDSTVDDFAGLTEDTPTEEQIAQWNDYIEQAPQEILDTLYGAADKAGIDIQDDGEIMMWAATALDDGSFDIETVFDPFSGDLYLSQAEFDAADPTDAADYISKLLDNLINTGDELGGGSIAVSAYGDEMFEYTQMGFLPDPADWQSLRLQAMDDLQGGDLSDVLNSFDDDTQATILNLLTNPDEQAFQTLSDLDLTYNGDSLISLLMGDNTLDMFLDLGDDDAVARAKEYLGYEK